MAIKTTFLALLLLVNVGCGVVPRGLLYTDTIQPFCHDLRGTKFGSKSAVGSSKRVKVPTTQVDLSAEWDTRAIGDIARRSGIETVYGCDSRRESILLGIWSRDEIIIYGE